MKIVKPQNMALMFKSLHIDGSSHLSLAVCACFSFQVSLPDRLLDEQEMWPLIEGALEKEELFDFGVPKIRGEFLVYGSALAPKPVPAQEVAVQVGGTRKTLVVFGDRYWTRTGGIEDPAPFTSMPIRWSYAFGGPDFTDNPAGKGACPDASGRRPLPNVQDPQQLVSSPHDTPKPAGFTAWPMNVPQRLRYLGKVDEKWLQEEWPHFPRSTDWEYFQTAPEDQRWKGFFTGDEKVEIVNMHPREPILRSALPALRPRLFAHRQADGKEIFQEISCRAETLWLFPDREAGILLYRGVIGTADEDYPDILHLYGRWESLREPPQPLEVYARMFQEELTPPAPGEEASAPPPSPAAPVEPSPKPPAAPAPTLSPELSALLKDAEELESQSKAILKKAGIDPEEAVRRFMPPGIREGAGSMEELGAAVAVLEKQTAELMKKFNVSAADVEKAMKLQPPPPAQSADEIIAGLRSAGFHKPEVEAQLKEAERMAKEAAAGLDNLAARKGTAPVPPPPPPPEPPPAGDVAFTVDEVMARYSHGESLQGLDLSGLDFTERKLRGADFTGAALTGASFGKCDLTRAIFKEAILKDADFTESDLTQADLEGADASGARFKGACLKGGKMTDGDFTGADFTDADFTDVAAAGASFEGALLEGVMAQELSAPGTLFARANLNDADLSKADLEEADFTEAQLTHCVFNLAKARGICLNGATGEHTKFGLADLTASRADGATALKDGRFYKTELTDACWEGAQLHRAQLIGAVLTRADFSNCDLTGATMILASAREAKFAKADLTNANLTGIDLFKGSLRKAVLIRTDLKLSNLFAVDFYQAQMKRVNLYNANINRTLLKLRGGA